MTEAVLVARKAGTVRMMSELGPLPAKFVGDRRYSKRRRAWLATKAAFELVADIDWLTFGEDHRWMRYSTPEADYMKRVMAIADEIIAR